MSRAGAPAPAHRGFGASAAGIASLTLAARIVGFGRSLVFSKTVGDTCLGDVYNAANTLPNVLFEIVAGGVLAGVVVPVVARHVANGRREAASVTTSALLTWTLLVLTVPALAALAGAGAYARIFTKASCTAGTETLAALVVMFVPQIWLYGLAVVSAGVLQAHHRFLAAAAAPLVSSAVVISAYVGYLVVAGPGAGDDLVALSRRALLVLGLGTTAGVLALALTTTIGMVGLRLRLRPRLRFAPGDRAAVLRIGAAGLAGLVMQQVSILVITLAAQQAPDTGALTRYTWAAALYLLPYAVLTAPLIQLIFPRLSAAAEQGPGAVSAILASAAPPIALLACLGAAVLAGTAVPVARIFIVGPGSGDTLALARPVAAFAPAVVGFTLLSLALRTLLARHRARDAGLTGVVAWSGVVLGAAVAWAVLPGHWLVTGLAAAMSCGLLLGAVVGWWRVGGAAVLARPLAAGGAAGAVAAVAVGWPAESLAGAGLAAAVLGACAGGLGCTAVFAGVVWLIDRNQIGATRRLLRRSEAGP